MRICKSHLLGLMLLAIPMMAMADVVPSKAEKYNQNVTELLAKLTSTADSAAYYLTVSDAMLKAVECDRHDSHSSFVALNQNRLIPLRDRMLQSALHVNSYRPDTLKRFINSYIETADSRLFAKSTIPAGEVALHVANAAYAQGNHDMANYYADVALCYSPYAERAAEVKVKCLHERLYTPEDSTKYLMLLLELHDQCPANRLFFTYLIEHLERTGDQRRLIAFADDELRRDSTNVRAWIVKAEQYMNAQKWEKSIGAYSKVLKYEPALLAADYNLGICYSARAIELKDSLVDNRGRLSKSNRAIVRENFNKAKTYLEKVKDNDPEEKTLKWRKPLYQAYYALGLRRQAKELKADIKED